MDQELNLGEYQFYPQKIWFVTFIIFIDFLDSCLLAIMHYLLHHIFVNLHNNISKLNVSNALDKSKNHEENKIVMYFPEKWASGLSLEIINTIRNNILQCLYTFKLQLKCVYLQWDTITLCVTSWIFNIDEDAYRYMFSYLHLVNNQHHMSTHKNQPYSYRNDRNQL